MTTEAEKAMVRIMVSTKPNMVAMVKLQQVAVVPLPGLSSTWLSDVDGNTV